MGRTIRASESAASDTRYARHWAASPLHDRDGVIRFPHRPKISSILIRNTVAPIATPTTLGSCLAIEASNHRKPGVVMSTIPLDVQRRCERRWAARLSRPTESVAPRNQRPARESQQIAGPADNSEPQQLSGSPRTLGADTAHLLPPQPDRLAVVPTADGLL
jgi:hypothetical protein